jgi:predicted Ser/Thr protein kinase
MSSAATSRSFHRRQDLTRRAAPDRVAKTEPGDENNQDISALVGKVDIRQLEHFGQNDPDAYSYSGGLNRTTRAFWNSSRCSRRRSRCCTRC